MKNNTFIFRFNKKIIFYFILICNFGYSQSKDTLTILTEDLPYEGNYLILRNQKTYVGNSAGIIKGRLMKNLTDFPELRSFVKKNLKLVNNYEDVNYLKNIIRCYNDASVFSFKIENASNFFHKYNLYTRKEIRNGPTTEMLKIKQFINSKTLFIENSTTHTDNKTLQSTSTYGSQFKSHFTYGNSPFYSSGFLLKNLKKAIKDDKEAVKYINKYRFKYISRTAFNMVGLALASFVIVSIADKEPFGLSDKFTPYIGATSVIIIGTRVLRPAKYKDECIQKAVEIYNMHLQNEIK
jgi:hypothetical protein